MVITRLTVVAIFAAIQLAVVDAAINVTHYAPSNNNINNLTFALTGTGAPGIFSSSNTPDAEYGIYNWCNMPHVRTREYKYVSRVTIL
jgi:2-phosphoxylose phosphatase